MGSVDKGMTHIQLGQCKILSHCLQLCGMQGKSYELFISAIWHLIFLTVIDYLKLKPQKNKPQVRGA
jgi:hypothetical protein